MYAQYALGMVLMFGVMRSVNIAHGNLLILLALIGVTLPATYSVGPVVALMVLVPLAALIGYGWQRPVLNRVVGSDPLPSLIVTFGLAIALQNLMLQIWSADMRPMPGGGIEQA